MALETVFKSESLADIAGKVEAGERLSREDGIRLFESGDLLLVGRLADIANRRKNGKKVYFIQNRHINYSNVCKNRCRFCAFSRSEGQDGAYTMSLEQVFSDAANTYTDRVSEFHIVGGLHPSLPFDYYLDMMRGLKSRWPDVIIQGFTAVEIAHFADISGLGLDGTIRALMDAGLDSLPGGGAEVFEPSIRQKLCPEKLSGQAWLEVHEAAHRQGMKTNATMLYGHIESHADRVDHFMKLRELQDRTHGFLAFIPLAFHPRNTDLPEGAFTTGFDDLKVLAIARLMLDNFDHIKAFWIMIGPKMAQVSLSFGVDDIDGTVVEERITHAAGAETAQGMTLAELLKMIRTAGKTPVERDTLYKVVQEY
jgi:aminodeoxyfutalosine synthase